MCVVSPQLCDGVVEAGTVKPVVQLRTYLFE
jgi:hypothetical protein